MLGKQTFLLVDMRMQRFWHLISLWWYIHIWHAYGFVDERDGRYCVSHVLLSIRAKVIQHRVWQVVFPHHDYFRVRVCRQTGEIVVIYVWCKSTTKHVPKTRKKQKTFAQIEIQPFFFLLLYVTKYTHIICGFVDLGGITMTDNKKSSESD